MSRVDCAPPSKDGGFSIRNLGHRDCEKVRALRDAIRRQLGNRCAFEGVWVKMVMHYRRGGSRGDVLNLINGVADIIQRRRDTPEYRCDAWPIDDDRNIREFHYREERARSDWYEINLVS